MASPMIRYCKYSLIFLVVFSELVNAANYEDAVYDGPRFNRDTQYGFNPNIQNIEVPNFMDNPENLGMPVIRDARESEAGFEYMEQQQPSPEFVDEPQRFEREPEPVPVPESVDQGQNIDVIDQGVAEEIPEAQNRKVRGNGADLSAEAPIIGSQVVEEEKVVESRSAEVCQGEGENCVQNSGCCSKFCSWTRGFTCYTFNG